MDTSPISSLICFKVLLKESSKHLLLYHFGLVGWILESITSSDGVCKNGLLTVVLSIKNIYICSKGSICYSYLQFTSQ